MKKNYYTPIACFLYTKRNTYYHCINLYSYIFLVGGCLVFTYTSMYILPGKVYVCYFEHNHLLRVENTPFRVTYMPLSTNKTKTYSKI